MTFRWTRRARELFERWLDVERFGAGAGAGSLGIDERVAFEVIGEEQAKAVDDDGR